MTSKASSTRGQLPEPLARQLREHGEDRATVIIDSADGRRHGSPTVDLSDPAVKKRSYLRMRRNVDRFRQRRLSDVEKLFLSDEIE
jgi:hypothetical protein